MKVGSLVRQIVTGNVHEIVSGKGRTIYTRCNGHTFVWYRQNFDKHFKEVRK